MKSEREDILDLAEEETATDPLVDVEQREGFCGERVQDVSER